MDNEARRKICQLVAGIIISDDILDDKEQAFMDRVIKGFGIEDGSREVIFPLVDHKEAAEQMKDLPKEAQDEAFRLLVEAALVDGQVTPEEREYLLAIAKPLGISEAELDRRLAG